MKRGFDLIFSLIGLVCLWPVIAVGWFLARRDTGASGLFVQERVGRHGRHFRLFKLRTMRPLKGTTVTTKDDPRITKLGRWMRRWKIDEFPQLWNVLTGDMSFVGPRPDVPEFTDCLEGKDREILSLRPGITGPATLKYRAEEEMLADTPDPEAYNREVIWPDKVKINREYLRNWTFVGDLRYILRTLLK